MKTRNVLRDLMDAGKPTLGVNVYSPWPGVVEVIGHSGAVDYVEFAGQDAPYDLFALENFGRTIDLFDHMSSMMKLDQEPRTFLAERAVSSGVQNLLFADIETADDARQAVAAMRPATPSAGGRSGVNDARDSGWFIRRTIGEYARTLEQGVVALMIEKKNAVENLEEILAVPGVDMVQFGPADYSVNIGVPGEFDHPDVKKAERHTIETAMKMGLRPRVELEHSEQAKPYLAMGVIDFRIGTDLRMIHDYCIAHGGALARTLGRQTPAAAADAAASRPHTPQ